jgi:hypothetical protein
MRALFAGLLLLAGAAAAQEGFPLDGTWRGVHAAPDGTQRTIVLIMEWDGRMIGGTINPGPDSVTFESAALEPADWKFTLAAKGPGGTPIAFTGTLGDIGRYDRTLTGKWSEGQRSFDIRFVRE